MKGKETRMSRSSVVQICVILAPAACEGDGEGAATVRGRLETMIGRSSACSMTIDLRGFEGAAAKLLLLPDASALRS